MIDYIKLIFAVAFPVFLGYVFLCAVAPKKEVISPLEKLALSFLIGAGILTLEMFLLGAFKIKLDLVNIISASLAIIAIPAFVALRAGSISFNLRMNLKIESFKLQELLILAMILVRALFVIYEDLLKPVIGCDAFANWSLRAKVFFFESGLSLDPGSNYFAGGGHAFYPINMPLMETWVLNVLGYWNDALFKIIFALFFLSLLMVFYCSIRRSSSRFISLFSTYLLSTLPLLVYHSTIEYADLLLCVYFTASVLFLLNYFESNDPVHLYISAVLAGIGTWTKSEGMPLLLINLLVIYIFYLRSANRPKTYIINMVNYFLVAMIFKVPWSIFNLAYHIPKNVWQKIEYTKAFENLYRIPVIIEYFYKRMLFFGNWNIAWFVFMIVLILSLKKLGKVKHFYSLMFIFLVMSAFAFLYYITPSYAWLLDGTTVNRNTLIVMPLVIFFISINLPNGGTIKSG